MAVLSPEKGRNLNEVFHSFMVRHNLIDDSNQDLILIKDDFNLLYNGVNTKLCMSLSTSNKPYFYVKKQIPSYDDTKPNYHKSIQNEMKIILENFNNRINYEKCYKTKIFNCKNVDKSCQYSPFLSIGKLEKNYIRTPFYPLLSLRYIISKNINVTNTDKQVWAYELSSAFLNLHRRGFSHSFFTSNDVFLTPNFIENESDSSKIYLNIVLNNFSYELEHEKDTTKYPDQFHYRCPKLINNSIEMISKATLEQLQKSDVYSFGIFLIELFKWEEPSLLFQGISRKDILKSINEKSQEIYLKLNSIQNNNPWISLIIRCTDKNPINRPSFDEINEFLSNKNNFLNDVDFDEFDYRIQKVKIDTNCYFETLAYINLKYPNFNVIDLILNDIVNEMITQYEVNFNIDKNKPIVDQLFQMLGSSFCSLQNLIKERKDFFLNLFQNNFNQIIQNYTKNDFLINLVMKSIQNINDFEFNDNEIKKYSNELLKLIEDLSSLSDLYYKDKLGNQKNEDFFYQFYKKDLDFLLNQFSKSIQISEDQIKIIYENLFDFDYTKTVEFLTNLYLINKINPNYFSSLEKVYSIIQKVIKNSDDNRNSIDEVNNIMKSIYNTIYLNINEQSNNYFNNNGITFLVNKIESLMNHLNENDKTTIYNCLKILKNGLKIKESSNFIVLNYAGPAMDIIFNAVDKRRERLQTKRIYISNISKSSLRSYITRILKSYKSSYKIQISFSLDKDCQKVKINDINEILTKMGVTGITIESNLISFVFNGSSL